MRLNKVFNITFLTLFLIMLLMVGLYGLNTNNSFLTKIFYHLKEHSYHISNDLSRSISGGNINGMQRELGAYSNSFEAFEGIAIYDNSGKMILGTESGSSDAVDLDAIPLLSDIDPKGIVRYERVRSIFYDPKSNSIYHIVYKLDHLHIGEHIFQDVYKPLIMLTIVMAILYIVFYYLLSIYFTRPVSRLLEAVEASVSEGDIDRNPIMPEIAVLHQRLLQYHRELLEERNKVQQFANEQSMLLSLFDKGDSVLFKWNNDEYWSIAYVSANVGRLMGYDEEEFMSGKVVYASCIHPDDLGQVFSEVQEAIRKNADYFVHSPYRIITKEGEERWILDHTVTQKDESGAITHFIGYLLDISERIGHEKVLNEAKEHAEAANRAKSEFLANMSHEIRTPLNGIIGLTELVLHTELDTLQRDYLLKSRQSSNALLHIINDILDYSKIEAGKLDILKSEFDLNALLGNISDLFGYMVYEKGLDLTFTLDPEVPLLLYGDPLRITQVLNNLIGNSIKFTDEGFVNLDVALLDKSPDSITIRFSIRDSGIGIDEEHQSKLFRAFEQGDGSTTKKFGGTGLGLMICKKLVEMMGGTIWFESRKGRGSTFSFSITLGYSEQSIVQSPVSILPKGRFLIVEDNDIERTYLGGLLKSMGITVEEAPNGSIAWEMIQKEHFDYMLIDWKMPGMDGLELLERLSGSGIKIPRVLMITAYAQKEFLEESDRRGIKVDKILEKPYTPSTLYDRLSDTYPAVGRNPLDPTTMSVLTAPARTLLVEDNQTNQIVAGKTLEKIGFDVVIAQNGIEAVEMMRGGGYDIVFMDIQMPVMDGFEATKNIRTFDQETPIIALSAAVMQRDKELTRAAGMNGHIAKPIDQGELLSVISHYFGLRSAGIVETPEETYHHPQLDGVDMGKLFGALGPGEQRIYGMLADFGKKYRTFMSDLDGIDVMDGEFAKSIHKLKGLSGNLQMQEIFDLSYAIEKAEERTGKSDALSKLGRALAAVVGEIEEKIVPLLAKEQTVYNSDQIVGSLDTLVGDIESFNYIGTERIRELVGMLSTTVSAGELETLQQSFADNDYETLSATLRNIRKEFE